MKIIDIYSPKGGVSKTTLASNIAACLVKLGYKVVLADMDKQKSSCGIFAGNDCGFDVCSGMPKSRKYDYCIADHHPSHNLKPTGDHLVLPLRPARPDFESFKRAFKNLDGIKKTVVVSQVDRRLNDDKVFTKYMQDEYNALTLLRRNIYVRAIAESKTVFDMGNAYKASEARKEIKLIVEAIINA